MKRGSKKAQFFLMAAIIIILVLYTLTINYNWAKESVELTDYAELRDTYNAEVPKVLNRAIFITTDPSTCTGDPSSSSYPANCPLKAMNEFSTEFQKYSTQKDPNFGLISIFKDPYTGNLIVKNLLAGGKYIKINTKPEGQSEYTGKEIKILWSDSSTSKGSVNLNIGGQDFTTSTKAPLSYYGENLTSSNLGNLGKLSIEIEGQTGSIDITPDTYDSTISSSSNPQGVIAVDVCPGGANC